MQKKGNEKGPIFEAIFVFWGGGGGGIVVETGCDYFRTKARGCNCKIQEQGGEQTASSLVVGNPVALGSRCESKEAKRKGGINYGG